MGFDIIIKNFVDNNPKILPNDITSFKLEKRKSGDIIGIVSTIYGETFIKKISPTGVDETILIKLPVFENNEKRNEAIKNLYFSKKYPQDDIAIFFGLSQSQVQRILKENKK